MFRDTISHVMRRGFQSARPGSGRPQEMTPMKAPGDSALEFSAFIPQRHCCLECMRWLIRVLMRPRGKIQAVPRRSGSTNEMSSKKLYLRDIVANTSPTQCINRMVETSASARRVPSCLMDDHDAQRMSVPGVGRMTTVRGWSLRRSAGFCACSRRMDRV